MKPAEPGSIIRFSWLLNLLATVQVVWFYLARVPAALDLAAYESGHERLPFQQRMLLMLPLRFAHQSHFCRQAADFLNRAHGWFGVYSGHIRPESLIEIAIDFSCIAFTGLIARRIYQAASRTRMLLPFIYPLMLVMVLVTYAIQVNHPLRFLYDLPAMAFFSAGLYLLYFQRSILLFICVFAIATINRETSLLLLPAYWLAQSLPTAHAVIDAQPMRWRRLLRMQPGAVTVTLLAWWAGWHLWVVRHFAANASASGPRLLLNVASLLVPLAWPQLFSVAAYLWPMLFLYRRMIADATLRAWVWLPGMWFALMLVYGLLIETRIFGELIAYFTCATVLVAEQAIQRRYEAAPTLLVPLALPRPSAIPGDK